MAGISTHEAEETLSVIRTLMERGTRYTNLSGYAGIGVGLVALGGCWLRAAFNTPFVATWLGVLAVACAVSVFFTAVMAHANEEPLWTRQARTVVLSLLPSLAATLILTVVLARAGQEALLPGVWMLLWGVGALAMSFFTPLALTLLGVSFMGAGTLTLLLSPTGSASGTNALSTDALTMGLTFGAIHLVYGGALMALKQTRRSRAASAGSAGTGSGPGKGQAYATDV